jgi:SAM-dependent methyltransferase
MDIFDWITAELDPKPTTTEQLIYEHMESQSGHSLPIIYQPFKPTDRGHWRDRGAALDFVTATCSQGARVLDFGPGDGWPSLIIAPWVGEVVGVEGSPRRVAVCRTNAERLDITNVIFRYVAPGAPLPFEEGSFDAVVAASSVEQSPDPRATLAEFYRVLRPGGRLRLRYESLNRYHGGAEQDVWLSSGEEGTTRLVLYDRHIEEEFAVQVALTYAAPSVQVHAAFGAPAHRLTMDDITIPALERLRGALVSAGICTTVHPSGVTLSRWLTEIGFRQVFPTHDGMSFAGSLFDRLPTDARPVTLPDIDSYLGPLVDVVVALPAPVEIDPAITAVK